MDAPPQDGSPGTTLEIIDNIDGARGKRRVQNALSLRESGTPDHCERIRCLHEKDPAVLGNDGAMSLAEIGEN
jgi:hypothetical protein